jgi:hypothetical protein
VTLIGAGVTLHACLAAADRLRDEGIGARVIDLYSVKPADTATLSAAAAATGGRLVVAEDHHPEGGIGSAVVDALTAAGRAELSVAHLAVREMPGSGTTEELLVIIANHPSLGVLLSTDQDQADMAQGPIAPVSGHDHEKGRVSCCRSGPSGGGWRRRPC